MLSPGVFGIVALLILIYVVWRIVVSLFQSSNIIDSSTDIPDISPMILSGAEQAKSDLSSYFPTSLARTTAPNVPDPAAGINSTVSTADKLTTTAPNVSDPGASTTDKLTTTAPNVPDPEASNADKLATTAPYVPYPEASTTDKLATTAPYVPYPEASTAPNTMNISDESVTSFVPDPDIPNGDVVNVEDSTYAEPDEPNE
jgi:hypothetical protein